MRKSFGLLLSVLLVLSMLSVLQWQIKPAYATPLFTDGFESGTILTTDTPAGAWTAKTGTVAASTTAKNSGTYSCRCDKSVGFSYVSETIAGQTTVFARGYFDFGTLTADATGCRSDLIWFLGGTTKVGGTIIYYDTDHWTVKLHTMYPTDAYSDGYTCGLVINCWSCIELKFVKASGTSGEYRLFLNGTDVMDRTAVNTSGAPDIDTVKMGAIDEYHEESGYVYLDDCVIDSSYIGPIGAADTTKPTYSSATANETIAGRACNFSVTLADETALANFTFGCNNTASGAWSNATAVSISGTSYVASNASLTLNSTVGVVIQWEFWFADSSNNLNNTGIQTLTTINATAIMSFPYTISSAGSYTIGVSTNVSTAYGVTIHANNVYLDGQNLLLNGSGSNIMYWLAGAVYDNVTLVNLNCTFFSACVKTDQAFTRVDVENSTFGNSTDGILYYIGVSNSTIRNVYCYECSYHGVKIRDSSYNILLDNITTYNCVYGVGAATSCYNFTIQNCNVYGASGYAYYGNDDGTYGPYNYTIKNCVANASDIGFEFDVVQSKADAIIEQCVSLNMSGANQFAVKLNGVNGTLFDNCTFSSGTAGGYGLNGGGNDTFSRCVFTTFTYGYLGTGPTTLNFTLNNFQSCDTPVYDTQVSSLYHNAYSGNSSVNNLAGGSTVNDTALDLTMSKVGSGTISPDVGLRYVNGGNWSQTFTATPSPSCILLAFKLNGATVGSSSPLVQAITVDSTMEIDFSDYVSDLPKADQYVIQNLTGGYSQIRGSDNVTLMTNANFTYLANLAIANLTAGQTVVFNGTISQDGLISVGIVNVTLNYYKAVVTLTRSIIQCSLDANNITVVNGHWYGYYSGTNSMAIRIFAAYCTVDSVEMENYTDGGIFANYASSYVTIENCSIHDCENGTSAASACNIQQNNVNEGHNNFINDHFYNQGGGLLFAAADGHNLVLNCEFDHLSGLTYAGESGAHGIYFDGGGDSVGYNNVTGNSFHDFTGGAGLQIKCQNDVVYNNTFTNFISASVPFSIYSQYSGAIANDNDIYNNTYTNCIWAIMLGNSACASPTLRNKIYNSTFISVTNCIALDSTDPSTQACNDTQIYDNTFTNCTSIFPSSPSSPSLIGNTVIRDNNFNGISVGSSITTYVNTTIYNNTAMTGYQMLNLTVVGSGSTSPSGLGWQYVTNTNATVTWTPSGGSSRQDFSINGANQTTTTSPIQVNMTADKVCIAYFSGIPPVVVTVSAPTNTTYYSSTISISLSASGGTISVIWWNCKNGTSWIYGSNQTYTVPTSMTGFVNGTAYTFYAWANNTLGSEDEATVGFTVTIYIVEVTVTAPTATTYSFGTITVTFSATGGTIDTLWWNCKNGSDWIYGSNQTYTMSTSMTSFENGVSYTFYAWANNTVGTEDEATVAFAVSMILSGENLPQVNLPGGITLRVPAGMKLHLGDKWIYPQTVAITVTKWNVSSWINYTVAGSGIQQVYYGSEPTVVYIDGSEHVEGDGWSYGSSTATVTSAGLDVCLYYASYTPPVPPSTYVPNLPQTGSSQTVHFVVTMQDEPLEGCQVRIYENATNEYVMGFITGSTGKADVHLASGIYQYEAMFKDKRAVGSWLHVEEETVRIVFSPFSSTGTGTVERSKVFQFAVAGIVIVAAVFVLFTVKKKLVG